MTTGLGMLRGSASFNLTCHHASVGWRCALPHLRQVIWSGSHPLSGQMVFPSLALDSFTGKIVQPSILQWILLKAFKILVHWWSSSFPNSPNVQGWNRLFLFSCSFPWALGRDVHWLGFHHCLNRKSQHGTSVAVILGLCTTTMLPFWTAGEGLPKKVPWSGNQGLSSSNAPVSIVGRQVGFLERSAELM